MVKGATGGFKENLIGLLRDRRDAARAFDAENYTPVYGFTPGTPVRSSGEDCGTHDALSCRRRSENLPASEEASEQPKACDPLGLRSRSYRSCSPPRRTTGPSKHFCFSFLVVLCALMLFRNMALRCIRSHLGSSDFGPRAPTRSSGQHDAATSGAADPRMIAAAARGAAAK